MGLMKKFFGGAAREAGESAQFQESRDALQQTRSRNGPRRDLVRLTLRETLRKHGIPVEWIDCRMLSVLTQQHKSGMHVQFLVRQADQQMMPYVHAFQESFWARLLGMDPHARQWLFSVGWEFHGEPVQGFSSLPDADSWKHAVEGGRPEVAPAAASLSTQEEREDGDALASDLAALQAAISRVDAPAEPAPAAPVASGSPGSGPSGR